MAIRNAAVQKTAPQARNGYQIDKVATVRRADNDNRQSAANDNRPIAPSRRRQPTVANIPASMATVKRAGEIAAGTGLFLAAIADPLAIGAYIIQIAFAVISLIGLGLIGSVDSSSLLTVADYGSFGSLSGLGQALFLIGLIGALIFGALLAAAGAIFISLRGASPWRGHSVFILAICTLLHLCPIINIFPIMWLWCLYVSLAK